MSTEYQTPVWARSEAFPLKPSTGVFGFQDLKGNQETSDSIEGLIEVIKESKQGVDLVWSPESEHMLAPEELTGLRPVLAKRRAQWAYGDVASGKKVSALMGAAVLWSLYAAYSNSRGDLSYIANSPTVAVTAIMLLIFGLIPWYEGWKELRKSSNRDKAYWQKEVADARFDSWVSAHKAPFTLLLLGLLVLTGAAQLYLAGGVEWGASSVQKVGLLKTTTSGGDAWWRYLTAPMVHGNLVHWVMNFAALRYLARRTEVLARWPQMILVFLISAFVGGMATVHFAPDVPSVGASGGILGLLGFLLLFETLHKKLVPKSARKRLLAGLVMVGVMGVLGFSFIDNAAHAGGVAAGMLYALLVFPFSASAKRPELLKQDVLVGSIAAFVLIASAALSVTLLLR